MGHRWKRRITVARTFMVAMAGLLMLLIVAWVYTYRRSINIAIVSPVGQTEVSIVSRVFVGVRSGVVVSGKQRYADQSMANWDHGDRKLELELGPGGFADEALPPSYRYDTAPWWNRMGFALMKWGSLRGTSEWGMWAVAMPIWLPVLVCSMPLGVAMRRRLLRRYRARRHGTLA